LADAFLVLFVYKGVDEVALSGKADAEEDLELVADGEVRNLPVEDQ